ncbi:hypothetical protein LSS_23180 [Leptospira santarosai serovar Shermani str. LT 821]|uniref:Uncharacterized protein n=1 Tax=Leptospira santarosai serovar Shermani str. LT 821 TaxID=758847 RepID=A0A097ET13_9LEPT|nr:hypothetical protein LSS_23180 [Leptospira santarosai serovar Shermani str. LT 821]
MNCHSLQLIANVGLDNYKKNAYRSVFVPLLRTLKTSEIRIQ